MNISLQDAKALIDAAQAAAVRIDKPITVVVVDTGGFVVATERMDGARPLQPSIATAKAYTSAVMQRPSKMLKGWAESQPGFFAQVSTMGHHPIVATEGGMTIKRNGQLLGGLGVSGGTGDEDQEICDAALHALGYESAFAEWNTIKKD
ncbi:hypothetical protein PIGHUM_02497 [Pigmentiphaga humi]|uniref:Heme-binding protein n=1 Tax=Pigmentiphaga humi TaxID=2478468 RepID=A0A3P4B5I2_9BURK|nr:heme-binding protein [Pigmentiphaga humi]VCU70425.1 hypothetical protein PIGHUM_02497 [Pigmentiphaga humi]